MNVIDGILSDDVDNFLFGARVVIRKSVQSFAYCVLAFLYPFITSPGRGLTGNISNPALNSEGKDDTNHVRIFDASVLEADKEIGLTRAGFILIGLLSGGDYEEVIKSATSHPCVTYFRPCRKTFQDLNSMVVASKPPML